MWETWVQSLGCEDPLEKEKATHSSILAWIIPWTVWSMGLQWVGHDWWLSIHFISALWARIWDNGDWLRTLQENPNVFPYIPTPQGLFITIHPSACHCQSYRAHHIRIACQCRRINGQGSFCPVQSLSHVQLFATPWTAACQASQSIINSRSLLKLVSTELVMPSNQLILCSPLLLPPSIFPSMGVFSNESALHIRWPKY